ncbi:MAG: MGMT family protein [Candidatus Paceibacterota bacterium]
MKKSTKLSKYINPVFKFLKTIPKGKVVTYKNIARHCGIRNARNIGWVLKQNTESNRVPCYKVICSNGKLAGGYKFGGQKEQKKHLLDDGIEFNKSGRIKDFKVICYN